MGKVCNLDGCVKQAAVKGMCRKHYQELRPRARCSVLDCTRKVHSFALCEAHYKVHYRQGTLIEVAHYTPCTVANCSRPATTRSWCQAHYCRWLKKGDVDSATPVQQQRPHGSGSITKDGYKTLQRPGHPNASASGAIQEHRLVVANFLGRPLCDGESVHHRNGNRQDNTVGVCLLQASCACPEGLHNLELWHTGQPSGQRVADKIKWALEFLSSYSIVQDSTKESRA